MQKVIAVFRDERMQKLEKGRNVENSRTFQKKSLSSGEI